MKIVKITCDCCKKQITDKRFKLFACEVGVKDENGKNTKSFEEETLKVDFCENCVKKILKIKTSDTGNNVQVEQIIELKEAGFKMAQIADKLGITLAKTNQMYYNRKK